MGESPEDPVGYQKFIDSLNLDFYKWHDGIGFDLDTLRKLAANDKELAVALLSKRELLGERSLRSMPRIHHPASTHCALHSMPVLPMRGFTRRKRFFAEDCSLTSPN
jgi:hypothetical protein